MDLQTICATSMLFGMALIILGICIYTLFDEDAPLCGAIMFFLGLILLVGGCISLASSPQASTPPQTIAITDKFTNGGYFYVTDEYGNSYSISANNPADTWHRLQIGKTYSANKYSSSVSIVSTEPYCPTPVPTCKPVCNTCGGY